MVAGPKLLLFGLVLALAVSASVAARAQSQDVREAQERLATFGYDPGPADGIIGPKTRSALRSFQEQAGLPVSGEADPQTLDALGIASES